MARRLLTVSAVAVAFAAFFNSSPPPVVDQTPTRGLGLIEHREQFYRFEDLMNPQYRAASDDPFVRSFASPAHYAEQPWAGLDIVDQSTHGAITRKSLELVNRGRETTLSDAQKKILRQRIYQHYGVIPWAGSTNPGERE